MESLLKLANRFVMARWAEFAQQKRWSSIAHSDRRTSSAVKLFRKEKCLNPKLRQANEPKTSNQDLPLFRTAEKRPEYSELKSSVKPCYVICQENCKVGSCHPEVLRRVRLDSSEYLRMTGAFATLLFPCEGRVKPPFLAARENGRESRDEVMSPLASHCGT